MATGEFNRYIPEGFKGLLYIEPKNPPSKEPVIDNITKMMVTAWRSAESDGTSYRGIHTCSCGAHSDNTNYIIDGFVTNSLCIHYLAYHRDEVPDIDLDKVASLLYHQEEPTIKELKGPVRASKCKDTSFIGSFADYLKANK